MALILGAIFDIISFLVVLWGLRAAWKIYKRYAANANKFQNGKVIDKTTAEKLAIMFLSSDKEDEIKNFLQNNIHLLTTETVNKLVDRLNVLKISDYDTEELKFRFERLEKQQSNYQELDLEEDAINKVKTNENK